MLRLLVCVLSDILSTVTLFLCVNIQSGPKTAPYILMFIVLLYFISSRALCNNLSARGRRWRYVQTDLRGMSEVHFAVLLRSLVDLERPKIKVTDANIANMPRSLLRCNSAADGPMY